MVSRMLAGCLLLLIGLGNAPCTAQVVLFNANLGTTPNNQGWAFVADPLFSHTVTQTAGINATTLDTRMPITDRGGYFSRDPLFGIISHPSMPVIDRQMGYAIEFGLQLGDETHTTGAAGDDNGDGLADRAGFAMIAISADLKGIELSFWEDRIWTQDDDLAGSSHLFTQAEGSPFNTTSQSFNYQLQVLGDAYQLTRDGGVAPIVSGRLRDYRNFSGSVDPYELPNFLFFGDNTTRGESLSHLARIAAGGMTTSCHDADALVVAILNGQNNSAFDMNSDGLVNSTDLSAWLQQAGAFRLGPGRAFLPGDANLDGVVDGTDFGIWNSHKFLAGSGWCSGDFNADGFVDGSDFGVWNSHKFTSSLDGSQVPEPGAGLVLCLTIAAITRPARAASKRLQNSSSWIQFQGYRYQIK